ncbi:unnamed protein product [Allacma fusca]|uniref:Uncharacterized protein n=1 Tax=Allacma fusca TaxID=39272 RepID=A0A8J2NY20_9HEXA|nr:unnamed protein product [Allacma fusca]
MKFSNFLESALTDLQCDFGCGSRHSGPTRVVGNFSEVFSFRGAMISNLSYSDVPTNETLINKLNQMPPAPDVWMMTKEVSSVGKCRRFSCNVEFVNCLNVPLRNRNKFYSNSNDKDFVPPEIQSFHRESFLGSSDTNLEAMFSYEILSTDLALVIALKVGPGTNSFAAAFTEIPAVTEKKDLEALMNPNEWKIHDYVKYSNASKTLEVISVRNIRVEILMTEGEKSVLKIRIYAV